MFYLKREREERAAGRSEEAALEAAAATSGRSVLISGLTVIIAMSGMFLAGIQGMSAFAVGTILVVAVAMLGSLTVLPATLSWLGDRVDRGRVPFISRLRRDDGEGRIWGAILTAVLRRPVVSAVLAAGFLLALAVPALQLRTVQPGIETFPQSLPRFKLTIGSRRLSREARSRPASSSRPRTSLRRRCRRRSGSSSGGRWTAGRCTSRSRST